MVALLSIICFVVVASLVFSFAAAWMAPGSQLAGRLQQLVGTSRWKPVKTWPEKLERAMAPAAKAVPRSPSEVSKTTLYLMRAGYRDPRHLTIYFGIRAISAAMAFLLLFVTGFGLRHPLMLISVPLLFYLLPKFILFHMVKRRQLRIRLALPDALDLLVICVEAGLGLDQALKRVGEELLVAHPQLSDELDLVTLELRAGKPRPEALRNVAMRTGVDDLKAFVAVLVQTDRFGTSVAQALRVHSDGLRTERRQRAEEAAAKTTIKMVPVLVLCLFPAMFIVALGPPAIQVIRHVLPLLEK